MWRCSYCRGRFDDRDDGINHARAYHGRDYTACEYAPRARTSARGWSGVLAALRPGRRLEHDVVETGPSPDDRRVPLRVA